jgi:hypothetical protein
MSCWCDGTGYVCLECEVETKWAELTDFKKMKLLKYLNSMENYNLMLDCEKLNLCVSMIPGRYIKGGE